MQLYVQLALSESCKEGSCAVLRGPRGSSKPCYIVSNSAHASTPAYMYSRLPSCPPLYTRCSTYTYIYNMYSTVAFSERNRCDFSCARWQVNAPDYGPSQHAAMPAPPRRSWGTTRRSWGTILFTHSSGSRHEANSESSWWWLAAAAAAACRESFHRHVACREGIRRDYTAEKDPRTAMKSKSRGRRCTES